MAVKLGIAPDSWGVWFPQHEKQPPWDRCLNEMQAAGYAGVELGPWGYLPNEQERLKTELEARNLELVAGTVGGNFLDAAAMDALCEKIDDVAELMKAFPSARYIVLLPPMYTDEETGALISDPELSDEQWAQYAANVQRVTDRIRSHGLEAAFHPHADSHVQTEAQIERLPAGTDHHESVPGHRPPCLRRR
jgi:inosose dehydratase